MNKISQIVAYRTEQKQNVTANYLAMTGLSTRLVELIGWHQPEGKARNCARNMGWDDVDFMKLGGQGIASREAINLPLTRTLTVR